jgi:hypothetical protein
MALFYRGGTSKAIEEKNRNGPGFLIQYTYDVKIHAGIVVFGGCSVCLKFLAEITALP